MAEPLFYKKAAKYWSNIPATTDGVLGGFGHISDIDIDGSKAFLEKVFALENPPGTKLALDCGAGIGRVTKHLLLDRFDKVDLLEQDEKFINAAKQSLAKDNGRVATYHDSLQTFQFKTNKKYDLIWCQWVLCHVTDYDIVNFLCKSKTALEENGVIVVKENITDSDEVDYDKEEAVITRPVSHMLDIYKDAGLKLVYSEIQKGFPDDIYPVHTFLLIPNSLRQVTIV